MPITHKEQQERWEREHAEPFALKQMDSAEVSGSIPRFLALLEAREPRGLTGVEMGCGKGRNVIWLAGQRSVSMMHGFDFSETAIREARQRAEKAGVAEKTSFEVMDATKPWKYGADAFDFGIDCTASTDIESPEGRAFAVSEMRRVLKPGGHLLVYVMSAGAEYHEQMINESPADEPNAFYHPKTGKFEKIFSDDELGELYKGFELVAAEQVEKTTEFFGATHRVSLHWRVYKK